MNDTTTTTIRDNKNASSQVEAFDVNFTQSSETVKSDEYSVRNFENYPSFVKFINNTLNEFDLLNEQEIIQFIIKNMGLIELIEKVTPLLSSHFPDNSFGLEFDKDPEIPSFNKLIAYVFGDDESFNEDWEEIKKVNEEINKLSLYDDSVKSLLTLDLW